jgi:hypothetical protein
MNSAGAPVDVLVPIPILRYVSRLRDTNIERNLRLSHSNRGAPSEWDIREAEFINDSSTQAFPESFDFLALFNLFSCSWLTFFLTAPDTVITHLPEDFAAVRDLGDPHEESIGSEVAMNHREIVNVLWISPNEFISSREFVWERADRAIAPMHQMGVMFCFPSSPYRGRKSMFGKGYQRIFTYSVDAFREDPENHLTPSETQFRFLRHMLRPLPVNFFHSIELDKVPVDFPPRLYSDLLSTLASPGGRPIDLGGKVLLELRLHSSLNREQLDVLCAQCTHPSVRLSFSKFHDDLSADSLNEVLHTCQGIRHIDFPDKLLEFQGSLFVQALRLTSLTLQVPNFRSVSQIVLERICSHKSLETLSVNFSQADVVIATSVLRHVLNGCPRRLQELFIRFRAFTWGQIRHAPDYFARQADERILNMPLPPLLSLVSVSSAEEDHDTPIAHMRNTRHWDVFITPTTMTNWFHQNAVPELAAPSEPRDSKSTIVVGLMVRSTNRGVIFGKTTKHTPCDLRTGNSSVIFAILRSRIGQVVDANCCAVIEGGRKAVVGLIKGQQSSRRKRPASSV